MLKTRALYILALISFVHCGGKTSGGITGEVEKALKGLDKEISAENCNGEGTAFSGVYEFNVSGGQISCEGIEKEKVKLDADEIEGSFVMECAQKDKSFNCAIDEYKWNGCINKDGSFVLGIKDGGNYNLEEDIEGFSKGDDVKVEMMSRMKGKIQGDNGSGDIFNGAIATSSKKKIACKATWSVAVELTHGKNDSSEESEEESK